jgi:hypothetical protein
MEMQANTDVIRNEAGALPLTLEEARCRVAGLRISERLVSAGIVVGGVAAFLGLVGLVEYTLYHIVQNWSISGVGPSVAGLF